MHQVLKGVTGMGTQTKANQAASLDLRAIEIFVAACNMRSMSRAATHLGISQAAVSQQIAKIEASFGVKLLERKGPELHVLPAGTTLLFHARRILQDVRLCEQSLRRFNGYSYPNVSLTIINTMSKILAPPLMEALDGLVEKMLLHTAVSMQHDEEILHDRTDILISALPFDPAVYEIHSIAREPLILLVPKGYLPQTHNVDLMSLAQALPFIHFSKQRRIGGLAYQYLSQLTGVLPQSLEFDQTTTVVDAVRRRAGWAIATPFCLLDPNTPLEDIDICMLPPPVPHRVINLVAKHGRFADLPAKLAAHCRSHLRDHVLHELDALIAPEMAPIVL